MTPIQNIFNKQKVILSIFTLLISFQFTYAQYLTGDTNPSPNSTSSYTFYNGNVYVFANWQITGGTLVSSQIFGNEYEATVQWGVAGSGSVKFKNKGGIIETLNVTIGTPGPAMPDMPAITNNCNSTRLTRGTPPSGEVWYWQSSSSGTSTSNSAVYVDRTTGTSYYLKSYKSSSSQWSDARTINYTITQIGCTLNNENYIHTITPSIETTDISSLSNNEKIENIAYFDGLGRKVQTRGIRQSPLGKDIVTHIGYDNLGRLAKQYLPFTSANSDGLFETDGQSKTITQYNIDKYGYTSNPYNEKIFDGSPLNRVLETGTPGSPWLANSTSDFDRTVKMGYATNSSTDNTYKVRWYKVTLDGNYTPTLTNPSPYYFPLNSLFKTVVKNENWTPTSGNLFTTEEFKNKFGQTILKRTYAKIGTIVTPHDTYYVYDNFNNLTYVIPPKVVTADGVNSTELNELCFQYKYDKYNRLVEKKIPGKGWEFIVYDKMNRPILTQDAVQRAKSTKEWLFTKYDAFGRIVYTGLYKDNRDRNSIQASADAHSVKFESKGSALYNYTNNAYPVNITSSDVYTLNYYDDYNFDKSGLAIPSTVYGISTASNVNSLPTGIKTRVLISSANYWVTTITGYDDKAREIYAASKNDFLNTTDINNVSLDFIGKTIETTTSHTSNTTVNIVDKFTYDHMGRLLTQKQKINTQAEELISKNIYDELGTLIIKKVGNTETIPLQTVDFKYNVKGWLTEINDVNNIGTDLFTFKINYNSKDLPVVSGYNSLYDGNIAETIWRTKSDLKKRGYQYKYDELSRITGALYRENDDLLGGNGKFTSNYSYDRNGNLLNLYRSDNTNNDIDELEYTYATSSNKLTGIDDLSSSSEGFQTNSSYTYETNSGNLTQDSGKGIASIVYNHLNLPTLVDFGGGKKIEYIYTAVGDKLQKKVTNGSITTTNYIGNYIYENNVLKHFSQPEGFVENNGSSFTYIYQYRDHLGSVRLNYTNIGSISIPNLQIREENNYYPFGLKHTGYNAGIIGAQNNYKYNSKELQNETINTKRLEWYDYGARNYDPTIGRFFNIDPLADAKTQFDKSPLAYTWNNPISLTDPDGMHPDWEQNRAGQELVLGAGASIGGDGSISGNTDSGKVYLVRKEDGRVEVISKTEFDNHLKNGLQAEKTNDFIANAKNDKDKRNSIWDFSDQIKKFKDEAKKLAEKGGIPSAYSINGYLNVYENLAYNRGRTYVTAEDIDDVDSSVGELAMSILPIGRIIQIAGKGYRLVRVVGGKFHVFEKTIKANLPGQARAVYQKIYNQNGKLIRMHKRDFKIDGRMYQNKPKFPNFPDSKKLH